MVTKEQKSTVNTLSNISESQKAILTNCIVDFSLYNIEMDENRLKFEMFYGSKTFETVDMDRKFGRVFGMFTSFKKGKNALHVLKYVAEGNKFSKDLFKNQSKITPKGKVPQTFNSLLETLPESEMEVLIANTDEWLVANLFDTNYDVFDRNRITTESDGIKVGDVILYSLKNVGRGFYGLVLDAPLNGWLGVLSADGYTMMPQAEVKVVPVESLPADDAEQYQELFEIYKDAGEEKRDKAINRLAQSAIREAKVTAKAEKAHERQDKMVVKLFRMPVTSLTEIEKVVEKVNSYKTLEPQSKEFLAQRLFEAKAKIVAEGKALRAEEKAKVEADKASKAAKKAAPKAPVKAKAAPKAKSTQKAKKARVNRKTAKKADKAKA